MTVGTVHSGQMRNRIAIERPTTQQDASGQLRDVWVLFASRRAEVSYGNGTEKFAAQQQVATAPTTWTIRFLDGVLPSMRVVNSGKWFDIVDVSDPDGGLRRRLVITTYERVGQAL